MFNKCLGNKLTRHLFVIFLLVAAILTLLLITGALFMGEKTMLAMVTSTMKSVRPWLYAFQLSVIGVVWLRWQSMVEWFYRRGKFRDATREALFGARHRIMSAILAFQLIVVMGIPFRYGFGG